MRAQHNYRHTNANTIKQTASANKRQIPTSSELHRHTSQNARLKHRSPTPRNNIPPFTANNINPQIFIVRGEVRAESLFSGEQLASRWQTIERGGGVERCLNDRQKRPMNQLGICKVLLKPSLGAAREPTRCCCVLCESAVVTPGRWRRRLLRRRMRVHLTCGLLSFRA